MMNLYNNIQDKITTEMQLPFLQGEIVQPIISNQWLYTLSLILSKSNKTEDEKVQYGVAIAFIQMALNLHDQVSLSDKDETRDDDNTRQITVLAGDYFSGRYYSILASLNDTPLIFHMANAIRLINENKVLLELNQNLNKNQVNESISILETHILKVVCEYLEVEESLQDFYSFLTLRRLEDKLEFLTKNNDIESIKRESLLFALEEVHQEVLTLVNKNKVFSQLEEIC